MGPDDQPPVVIERVTTPRGDLQLQRRGAALEVISNGCFLMATYNGGSEAALVTLGREWVPHMRSILVGGLGVGYTLRAALDTPGVAHVTVVEIEEKVVEWNRSHLAPFNGSALDDPRTHLAVCDLLDFLEQPTGGPFDLVALDTDNGPDWTVFPQNAVLWGPDGLDLLDRVLSPGGARAFWSSAPSPAFEKLLRSRYSAVRVIPIAAAVTEIDDVVYLAR